MSDKTSIEFFTFRRLLVVGTFGISFGIPVLGNWIAFNYVFTPAEYGVTSFIFSICAVAILFGTMGLEYHILRLGLREDIAGERQIVLREVIKCFWIVVPSSILVAAAVMIVLSVGSLSSNLSTLTLAAIAGFIVMSAVAKVTSAALRVLNGLVSSIIVDRVVREGGLLWGALIVFVGATGISPTLATFASSFTLVAASVLWSLLRVRGAASIGSATGGDARGGFRLKELPLKSARDLGAFSISEMIFGRIDILVLGILLPPDQLAPFAFYTYLTGVVGAGFIFLNFVYFAQYAALYEERRIEELQLLFSRIGRLGGVASILIVAALLSVQLASDTLNLNLIDASLGSPVFLYLAAGQVFATFLGPSVPGLVVARRSWQATRVYLLGCLARLVLLPIGLFFDGTEGAAIASLLAMAGTKGWQYLLLTTALRHDVSAPSEGTLGAARWPNLFLVGAPKCGTTALFSYLSMCPDIYCPLEKEPQFFCEDFPGLRQVTRESSYLGLYRQWDRQKYACDASVWYLYSEAAPREIKSRCGSAKIVVLVRNPIDMVVSFYHQATISLAEDASTVEHAWGRIAERRAGFARPAYCPEPAILDYFSIANYEPQIRRYIDTFGRENVHVIVFEQLIRNPQGALARLGEFLGVTFDNHEGFAKVNERRLFRSETLRQVVTNKKIGLIYAGVAVRPLLRSLGIRPSRFVAQLTTRRAEPTPIRAEFRQVLREAFRPSIESLEALLRADLSAWKA